MMLNARKEHAVIQVQDEQGMQDRRENETKIIQR